MSLHVGLLLLKPPASVEMPSPVGSPLPTRLDVRLTPQPIAPPAANLQRTTPPPTADTRRQAKPPTLRAEQPRSWPQSEREEMERFLGELAAPPKPPSGTELARRALAMARNIEPTVEKPDALGEIMQRLRAAEVEPLSIELYFEALFRKLNRSAAMVARNTREAGSQVAEVRVALNANGSVKSFTIEHSADQQAEIAYIQSVVERAAPFPVFPADIRRATDTLILQICIQPKQYANVSGAQFTRMARGQSCR